MRTIRGNGALRSEQEDRERMGKKDVFLSSKIEAGKTQFGCRPLRGNVCTSLSPFEGLSCDVGSVKAACTTTL